MILLNWKERKDYQIIFYTLDFFCQQEDVAQHDLSSMTSEERKQKWEQGQADYMGMDSFDNIQKKLDVFLK